MVLRDTSILFMIYFLSISKNLATDRSPTECGPYRTNHHPTHDRGIWVSNYIFEVEAHFRVFRLIRGSKSIIILKDHGSHERHGIVRGIRSSTLTR